MMTPGNPGSRQIGLVTGVLALSAFVLQQGVWVASASPVQLLRGPYLQSCSTSNLVVRWRTDQPTASHVRFGSAPDALSSEALDPLATTEHALVLTGLASNTKYFYAIGDGASTLASGADCFFTTTPVEAKATRIWAIGDAGTASFGSLAPLAVRDSYLAYTGTRPTDVWLMLGDNAYFSGTDSEYQAAVFDIFPQLLRSTPVWPTLGNHETYAPSGNGNIAYFDIFSLPREGQAGGVPSGTERYYAFDYGGIHFVCLDSELSDKSPGGPMLTWLEQDLAANTKEWLIAYWHSPPYSKGSHDSDFEGNLVQMRQAAVPLLESHGVDLVLCGHSHSYERSYLLNGHYGPSQTLLPTMVVDGGSGRPAETGAYSKSPGGSGRGAVYVVAGSSGQTSGGQFNHPAIFVALNRLGSMVIDVESNRLEAKFLRETGQVDDQFTILKADVAPSIVTAPASQTTSVGANVTLRVVASGSSPLTYQWCFNGTNIPAATDATLTLANVQLSQTGHYSVVVTNVAGSVTSPDALVMVLPAASCVTPPAGLVAWLPLDGDARDEVSGGQAVPNGAPVFAKMGVGMSFDGQDDSVRVSASAALDVGSGGGMTIEMWINPQQVNSPMALVEWSASAGSQLGLHLYSANYSVGSLFANLIDVNGAAHQFSSPPERLAAGVFQHIALTYDRGSGVARMFVNGSEVAQTVLGDRRLETRPNLWIGQRVLGGTPYRFSGVMDEVSVYNRALTPVEVQGIFAAGSSGKCRTLVAPQIVTHPVSQNLLLGESAVFTIVVSGTSPFSYQWLFDGQPLSGATNAALAIPDVSTNHAGGYSVIVQNQAGSATSLVATLVVGQPPPCQAPPADIVGWWPFDQGTEEIVSGAAVVVRGNPVFAPGKVGGALWLDGLDDTASVPANPQVNVGAADGFTAEGWIKPTGSGEQALVEWNRPGIAGAHFWIGQNPPLGGGAGSLFANLIDVNGSAHPIASIGGLVVPGTWQHVALTYDKLNGVATLFLNGSSVVQRVLGSFTPQTAPPFDLLFGHRVAFGGAQYRFAGGMDEWSLYPRALSVSEIQSIYQAAAAGKCKRGFPPQIVIGPQSQNVTRGSTVVFGVSASGTAPLFYQWLLNDQPISGATMPTLTLENVQIHQSGNYSVVVSNAIDRTASSNAVLVVNPGPALVRVVNANGAAGAEINVPVELVANGNENALGFSLGFDSRLLVFAASTVGAGAPTGATLLVNTNDAPAGRLGLVVGLSADGVFPEGTQQVALVTFLVAPVLNQTNAAVSFGDQPTLRQVSDVHAQVLPSVFTGGMVTIADSQFEGDVAPRPGGDRSVATIDWVQMGRFVARLDAIAGSNEFQRADSAPRATKGNGVITASDWVQAGRYAVGLDPLTVLNGPYEPGGTGDGFMPASLARQLCLGNMSIALSQTNAMAVTLECQGDENAMSFSVLFDPVKLRYVTATPGSNAVGAAVNINVSEAASGRIGVALALPPGTTLAPGSRQLMQMSFAALGLAPATAVLSFGDAPVPREVSDVRANALPIDYTTGLVSITVPPGPPLQVGRSGNAIVISWYDNLSVFELQATAGGLGTAWGPILDVIDLDGQKLAIISLSGGERYFRLKKR